MRKTLPATFPSPAGSTSVDFEGVACPSAKSCFAVGALYDKDGTFRTLVEQWTGKGWLILKSPNWTSLGSNTLEDVSCTSATNCWAVGQSSTDSGARPMTPVPAPHAHCTCSPASTAAHATLASFDTSAAAIRSTP